ncbi:transmembrane protein, putative [Medicago truncatula]|uniref:Transmembrane protein, putative n=1 Tax=Medicago truncatula TaxID=3880 RepID=A0A072UDA4_MEDTR|nr:transmembrane protein, putative [Medicago truncatula]
MTKLFVTICVEIISGMQCLGNICLLKTWGDVDHAQLGYKSSELWSYWFCHKICYFFICEDWKYPRDEKIKLYRVMFVLKTALPLREECESVESSEEKRSLGRFIFGTWNLFMALGVIHVCNTWVYLFTVWIVETRFELREIDHALKQYLIHRRMIVFTYQT